MIQQPLPLGAKSFFASEYLSNKRTKNILLIFASEDDAINSHKQLLFMAQNIKTSNILYFPSFDTIPYDRISPNQNILSERANILSYLASNNDTKLVVTSAINLLTKLPPPELLVKSFLRLHNKMQLSADKLAEFLVHNSFTRSSSSIDSGEFSVRGEIVDIVLPGSKAYRINFSWDHIESIKEFDIDTQISTNNCTELILNSASEVILNPETIKNFRDNYLKVFGVNYVNTPLYESVIEGKKFQGYEHLSPLFYNSFSSLINYLDDPVIIYDNLSLQSIIEQENNYTDLYRSRIESNKIKLNTFYPALPPEQVYFTSQEIQKFLEHDNNILITPEDSSYAHSLEKITVTSFMEDKTVFNKLFEIIENNKNKIPIIFCHSKSNLQRFKSLIDSYSRKYIEIDNLQQAKIAVINLAYVQLSQGFYSDKYLFIAAHDILGKSAVNFRQQGAKRKLKNILMELDNLTEGELIVHKDHGIGQFLNVETLDVKGKAHDFLKILYENNDKLYIPVENIELIKKYGSGEAQLAKLGSSAWQRSKAKLKNRITEIAEQLLKIAAKRKLTVASPIEFDHAEYEQFCHRFKYTETEDQLNAINDIKKDFDSGILMDRLICGDVGFGKTEVAIRATFMVAKSITMTSQVAIIVPTTILGKQHYLRFIKRFKDFGLNIVQLSSLVSNKDAKIIKEQIKNGTANIIIGTHALLSKNIEFNNLRLLIIDEEQHFGVAQKEYLKSLRDTMHVLSLSATPIPRTMQMSMVGLKDLSIIATPPMDRLEVRTTVMPFDQVIIRDALLRERFRGGRSFYVVPRIKDIPDIERYLQTIVPELKYKVAHGQMPAGKIDEIMGEFCDGKFDILVSTTIIESGIDIAEANTMIIHKSDTLGLGQLYQLRGRIGRSKFRGYAYLTLANYKKMTAHSIKRLEIMQSSCTLGSGFTIASHDMDLRGFGNLVGEEQSGQIKEVGVELYQEMLDEQIAIFKGEVTENPKSFVPTINLGLPVFISDNYIADSSLKLSLYRRIGNLTDDTDIENFKDEMVDRFGLIPLEFNNLLDIVKIKHKCSKLNIENLDSGERGFVLKFYKEADIAGKVMNFVIKHPQQTKIKPDAKLIFSKILVGKDIIEETNSLLEQLLVA
ncbi:transcription-repair coupling factor [Rickettsia endosymbiont of Oedothorax gibbosus]|uniref:transcription-repair coupling factor n=1 Tax=Rickettsia endosymbiont of Oedothorax gibbosus TaxID=931099 RepID=UPI002025093C|nr:transcription-repair coupling factor [Rickettsia endosymbiont of Oedothorax gibbosus]